ncbi:MAG: extracellular solute-binding protein [Anaerolineae bacterium]|nr:extracellular solute-binding protein [Anaerolineae bacterium]
MRTLELTIMEHGVDFQRTFEAIVRRFEARYHISVQITWLSWETAWSTLVERVVHRRVPHVSEIGSTWIRVFQAMEALRPFTEQEMHALGVPSRFFPIAVTTASLEGQLWGIPWMIDPRVIFYRKGILEKACIPFDPHEAFSSPDRIEQSLAQISLTGVPRPWIVPTRAERITVHHIASWIWSYGGDFVSSDGSKVTFTEEPALTGIRKYFQLSRWMGDSIPLLSTLDANDCFYRGEAAVTISGLWIWTLEGRQAPQRIGIARPPGPAFVGGSHLVIWKDGEHLLPEALELIRYLTDSENLSVLAGVSSTSPPALPSLVPEAVRGLSEVEIQLLLEVIQQGRTLSDIRLWGIIEERLLQAFGSIWESLASGMEIDQAIQRHLVHIAPSLNYVLRT